MADIDLDENSNEQTEGSGENLNDGVEDNSHSEKKNQSNFKKLAKKAKLVPKLQAENERLRAALAKKGTGESDDSDEDFDTDEEDEDFGEDHFTNTDSRMFFIENPEAKQYREEMEELLDENPKRKNLPLDDLFYLAKARFPKSVTKKTIDVGGGRIQTDVSKMDLSKMSAEEIEQLPIDVYRRLRNKK